MTSKEALDHICIICDNQSCPFIHYEKNRCAYYRIIKQDLDRLEQLEDNIKIHKETIKMQHNQIENLEKELKQTKSNFKNSQTHSKNCYKKLKNDMDRLINIIKDYSFITDYDVAWCVTCEDEEFLRKILK